MQKNRYTRNKHFLLIYQNTLLKKPSLAFDKYDNLNDNYYIPIEYFDTLLEIQKHIKCKTFINKCFNKEIYSLNQLKVLVGLDSKNLQNSINQYIIKDYNKSLFLNHGYYFFVEHVMILTKTCQRSTRLE